MTTDNNRYIVTAFDTNYDKFLIWSNDGVGLSKEKALSLYQTCLHDKTLSKPTVSKLVTVTEKKVYTFDNE